MDPDLVKQLNNSHARGIAMSGAFQEANLAVLTQLGNGMVMSGEHDRRLMNGFLANQLFSEGLVQAKSAFHTPVEPSPSPLPAMPQVQPPVK